MLKTNKLLFISFVVLIITGASFSNVYATSESSHAALANLQSPIMYTQQIALSSTSISFPDKNLETAIRNTLHKNEGSITKSDVEDIRYLFAEGMKITNLEGIQYLTNLDSLYLSNNEITNIKPLSKLKELTILHMSNNKITDITPLKPLLNLKELYIIGNKISDIKTLSTLTNLEIIYIYSNSITDITPLEVLYKLRELYIGNNDISDIQSLNKLTHLTHLYLDSNKISDIRPLKNLKNLIQLYLCDNSISDISSLKHLKNLTVLDLSRNIISDLTQIKYLTSLKELNIAENQITNLSSLSSLLDLNTLDVSGNIVKDPTPLLSLIKLEDLNLNNTQITNVNILTKFPNLSRFKFWNSSSLEDINLIEQATKKIISTVIKPGMSELEKELALHDYLINHTQYDYNNFLKDSIPQASHDPIGLIQKGIGVCDGYAETFQILLSMVGIDCYVVHGYSYSENSWSGHAWNIVKIDGIYYQVDPTYNDPISLEVINNLSHNYFNISDKELSISHKWERRLYKKCNTNSLLFETNLINSKNSIITSDWIFMLEEQLIYKFKLDGTMDSKVINDKALEISYLDGYIYYLNADDKNKLYRVKVDGTSKAKFLDVEITTFSILGDWIYYLGKDDILYKIKNNASSKTILTHDVLTTHFYISGNLIYYRAFNWGSGGKLYRMTLDGTERSQISNDEPYGFELTNNGTSVKYFVGSYEFIVNDWIYYLNKSDGSKIYKIKADGSNRTCLNSDISSSIEVIGQWIYYRNKSDGNKYYKMKLDGSQKQVID